MGGDASGTAKQLSNFPPTFDRVVCKCMPFHGFVLDVHQHGGPQLPLHTDPMPTPTIASRSAVLHDALPNVVAEMWVTGVPLTLDELAQRTPAGTRVQGTRRVPSMTLRLALDAMEADGRVLRRSVHSTVDSSHATPRAFNWSPLSLETATLRDAVAPYLEDAAVAPASKRLLRSALRQVLPPLVAFPLPGRCSDREILKAASFLPADRIHELPERARTVESGSADEYARAVRNVMRFAAKHRLVPLIFPAPRSTDPWIALKDAHFPLGQRGTVKAYRADFDAFRRAAESFFGAALPAPNEMTPEQAEEVIRFAGTKLGLRQQMSNLRRTLFDLRDRLQVGPFRNLEPNPWLVPTGRGKGVRFYLSDSDGRAVGADWDRLAAMVRANGFPDEWQPFIRWVGEYCSLSWEEFERRRDDFPARPSRRELDQSSQVYRLSALRAWLGVAIHELKMDPATLTPELALGVHARAIRNRLSDIWRERALWVAERKANGLPPEDTITDAQSNGLVQIVLGAGLWALGRYEWSRHARGQAVALKGKHEKERVDKLREMQVDKTPSEAAMLQTYIDSTAYSDNVSKDRRKQRGSLTTSKDLARIIEMMPVDRWVEIHTTMLQDLQTLLRKRPRADKRVMAQHRREPELEVASLGMATLYTGVLLSTACRESEALHIRLDTQMSPRNLAQRLIVFRGVDRPKTNKGHNVVLHEAIVPQWLLDLVLQRVRPYLMRERWIAKGLLSSVQDHPFLFVTEKGKAIGCVEETALGGGRDRVGMIPRQAGFSKRWQTTVARCAARLGIEVPIERGEFGEHPLRAAVGYYVYRKHGAQAAANLLGHSEKVLLESYAFLDARGVNVAELPAFAALGAAVVEDAPSAASGPSFLEEVNLILERAQAFGLDQATVQRLVADCKAKHSINKPTIAA